MNYQLAQINIAKFRLPAEHPVNNDFINSLDRVNASAEAASGFVWRFLGSENNELELKTFKDPNIIVNMSVWSDIASLVTFVYRNDDHKGIMRRKKEWFDKFEFHMVLWWIKENDIPTVEEAKKRMDMLQDQGPTPAAFTFKTAFSAHSGEPIDSFTDNRA